MYVYVNKCTKFTILNNIVGSMNNLNAADPSLADLITVAFSSVSHLSSHPTTDVSAHPGVTCKALEWTHHYILFV